MGWEPWAERPFPRSASTPSCSVTQMPSTALDVPARPDAIALGRAAARDAALDAGLPSEKVEDLVVAVSEACTNALEAQLAIGVTSPIELDLRLADGWFEVAVRDHGPGFSPADLPARPPLTDPRYLELERRWGIQLMRQLVDDLAFDVTATGTTVHLRMTV